MIIIRRTGFKIEHLKEMKAFSEVDINNIRKEEKSKDLIFSVPDDYISNQDRNIYKVGFLCNFLKELYPFLKFSEICKILNERYDVFVGRRQIERLLLKYNSNNKFNS